jgi:putative ABC transport system substrate-binding protein
MMRKRTFISLLGGAAAWPLAAHAQQSQRRIGVLMGYPECDPQGQANVTALRRGLQHLGWIEGRNVQIDFRWAGGDPDRARTLTRELIDLKADVIVSSAN